MRNNFYSQSIVSTWLKWTIIIVSLILIIGLIYSIYLYNTIEKSKTAGFAETKEQALQETDLTKINEIDRFDGKTAFHILSGEAKNGDKKIVFFPLDAKKKEPTVIDESEIIPRESMLNQWNNQCKSCEFIKISPAMVNDEALWELTYIDQSKRYTLDYLSIYDGSRYEQFQFKQMFN